MGVRSPPAARSHARAAHAPARRPGAPAPARRAAAAPAIGRAVSRFLRTTPKADTARGEAALARAVATRRLVLVTCGGPFDARRGHYRDNIVVTAVPL